MLLVRALRCPTRAGTHSPLAQVPDAGRHGNFGLPRAFQIAGGVRLKELGDSWAAYSPLSGETLQLNTEAASVLECLAEGPADATSIARCLANELSIEPNQIEIALQPVWHQLEAAGLITTLAG